jgi:hypothetical protein
MDIFVWFLQKNASALAVAPNNLNSLLFIAYVVLCLIIRRPVFLLAFFMSCMLFELSLFDSVKEYQLYLLTLVIYSYAYQECKTTKTKICCVIILLLSVVFACNAFFYGVNGYYGEAQTLVYNHIENLALLAHILFIWSFVDYKRVQNSIRNFIDSIVYSAVNSDYMLFYWYNNIKQHTKNTL